MLAGGVQRVLAVGESLISNAVCAKVTGAGADSTDGRGCGGAGATVSASRPTEMELKLPLEIIEGIISLAEDRRSLGAWALSCNLFRIACQRKMFEELTVSCDCSSSAFKEGGIVYSIAHEDGHALVAASIKRLKIENQYGACNIPGGGKAIDALLGKFVRKLTAVEELEIRGVGWEWRRREFADGLRALLQVPSMRVLRLHSLEHFPLPVVFWGRTLKKIEIEHVLFMRKVFVGFRKPVVTPVLEEFKMNNKEMGLHLLHTFSNKLGRSAFARLKSLQLDYREGEGDTPRDIDALLTACQDSLERLELFVPIEAYERIQLYTSNIRIGRLPKLRSFSTRLHLTTCDGYLDHLNPFAWLRELLTGGPPSLEQVQLTFFHRFGDVGNRDTPEGSGWRELDIALTGLTGLREVSVVVCCTQCGPVEMQAHEGVYWLPLVMGKGVAFCRRFTDDINSALEG